MAADATAAMTPDCNVAFETCKADCARRPIYDRERGGNVTHTDFVGQCQNACQDAAQWCLKQDAVNSCATFGYHCQSQCPWSVVDEDHRRLNHTDSFLQCENSCTAGATACEPFRKSLPPRKATGDFDVCPEAQTACYANCPQQMKDLKKDFSIADTNYPDQCAQACSQGVTDCQSVDGAESCEVYELSCWQSCPSSLDASGQSVDDPQIVQWCRNSCSVGRAYCRSLLNLPFDRNTAPALKPVVKPAATPAPIPQSPAPQKPAKPAAISPAVKPTEYNLSHCAEAEQYCKDDCLKNKIILVMKNNGFFPMPERYSNEAETDFWGQCEAACSRAKPACLAGSGFKAPCQKECPKGYHDKSGNTYAENDGQNRCQWSCAIGQDAYEGKADLNICERGYMICKEDCEDMTDLEGESFYNACEATCKAGETSCANAWPGDYCNNFYNACTDKCPQSQMENQDCTQACGDGAHECDERMNVRYD